MSNTTKLVAFLEKTRNHGANHLAVSLDTLSHAFGQPEGPSFESCGAMLDYRQYKAEKDAAQEVLDMLEAGSTKELLTTFLTSRLASVERNYHATCQSLANDYARPEGPMGVSTLEADWARLKQYKRIYATALNLLGEA